MTNTTRIRSAVVLCATAAVVLLPGTGWAQQAPDRAKPPAIAPAPALKLPAIQRFTLSNGMRIVLMEKHDLPLVQINLTINAGSVFDGPRLGLASLTAAMLDEGAAGKSALEIADAFEMLGARFGVGAGTHTANVSLRASTPRIAEALRLAADVLLRPDFPEAELERLRKERMTALIRRYDDPNSIASVLFAETLFGKEHPYGRSAIGTEATLQAFTPADLRAFYRNFYSPDATTAIVVGDITADGARQLLQSAFGAWPRAEPAETVVRTAPQVSGRVIYIVDKPGSAQSVVRFGRIGVPRSSRDYFALEVMNTILGGSFTSRLNQNLREKHGYSYGASSGFSYLPFSGPWSAAASVQTQSTGPALTEFMNELRGMHRPVPAEEVDRAKNFLAMRYPAGFQSVAGIAARLDEMVQYNLPETYFNRYIANVLAITKEDVERVAKQYIDPDNVTIFIVGDRKAIEEQVKAANLGDIKFLDVTDVLGPMPVMK